LFTISDINFNTTTCFSPQGQNTIFYRRSCSRSTSFAFFSTSIVLSNTINNPQINCVAISAEYSTLYRLASPCWELASASSDKSIIRSKQNDEMKLKITA